PHDSYADMGGSLALPNPLAQLLKWATFAELHRITSAGSSLPSVAGRAYRAPAAAQRYIRQKFWSWHA
ncbi:hypothetical protein, partial [Mangrovimicrobium sediminis]|uniref:hypothetical protein n=1 Tax=Mangrovimicrobium sediminis TaxID=2562682 RepID=UPI00197D359D